MEEIWKDIVIEKNGVVYDYTGLYQVSNYGRVRSVDRVDSRGRKLNGRVLKQATNNTGYLYVNLSKTGKTRMFSVHRLVATAFIPNTQGSTDVNHKDEDPTNNRTDNLEWTTHAKNITYSTHKWEREVICIETGKVFNSITQASQELGIHVSSICKCCRDKQKQVAGCHWMYYDEWLASAN